MKYTFAIAFIELAKDGKHRTVKQIREALELPETSNVGSRLIYLQSQLSLTPGAEYKLRRTTLRTESHEQAWWLERKGEGV